MWHEARKQEKLIKGMIVDYRRRAERRRDFYEKIKADPTQFLQLHGRPCKIHLDPAVAAAGESSAIMMPWQGDPDNMIDRFDVRAHLDYIPDVVCPDIPSEDLSYEERNCNYERYRILAQNMFLGISEEKFLHQLSIEEKYGVTLEEKEAQRDKQSEKKNTGAAIGFNYDSDIQPAPVLVDASHEDTKDDSDEESDAEIIDVDLSIDVNKIEMTQAHAMNACGSNFGMPGTDLFSFLTGDADEAEKSKQLMREEKEKALFSGRKSRRERRAHRDKKLALRVVSPPHYAARAPSPRPLSPSPTRSPSPSTQIHPDKITFITSFGGEEEQQNPSPERTVLNKSKTYASVLKDGRKRLRTPSPRRSKSSPVKRPRGKYPSLRKSSSRSRSRSRRSRSASSYDTKSRSSSNLRSKSRSRSKLRSRSRSKSLSSGSKSRSRSRRRSRSSSGSSRSRRRRRSRTSSSRRPSSSKSSSSRDNQRRQNTGSKFSSGNNNSNNASSSVQHERSGGGARQIPKYYGRKRDGARSSSSELSIDSESENDSETRDNSRDKMSGGKSSHVSNVIHSSGASSKQAKEKITAKERLKRKMQAQLSRQLRADMKAETERHLREQLLQQERDDEMRELAIKIRRRQRELRHQRCSQSSDDSFSPHQTKASPRVHSRDPSSEEERESPPRQVEKSQERRSPEKQQSSREPTKPKMPVWEHEAASEGHSSKYHNPLGRGGRNVSDFRGNYRDGNYDNRSHYNNSYQSRPYNKYSYRREDDGRSGFSERNRDQDYGKSGRSWQSRKEGEDGGHRSYTERGSKHHDGDNSAAKYKRDHDAKQDDNVVKYSNKKLVDY